MVRKASSALSPVLAGEQTRLASVVEGDLVEHSACFQDAEVGDDLIDDLVVVRRVGGPGRRAGYAHLLVANLAADERDLRLYGHKREGHPVTALAQQLRRFKGASAVRSVPSMTRLYPMRESESISASVMRPAHGAV